MKIASFDVFDTCLIRKCGNPENVFWILAKKLFPSNTAKQECFFHWRESVEYELTKNKENVTLCQIYKTLNIERFGLDSYYHAMEEEKQIERMMLVCNPSVKEIIERKRKNGYKIVFISDMYLDSAFLKDILLTEGCFKENDFIYVSCEYGETKRTGKLYDIVRNNLNPVEWCHWGDNYNSDYISAKKHGISAKVVDTKWNKVEKYILNKIFEHKNKIDLSCIVGLMRYSRLCNISKEKSINNISADFMTPIYTSYILDVLNQSRTDNIKRLYFLSRDGWILKQIAELLSFYYPTIELKFLYVSRKSLYLPSLEDFTIEELKEYWGGDFSHSSYSQLIDYFKIDSILGDNEIPIVKKDSLTNSKTEDTLASIIENSYLKSRIMKVSRFEREMIMSYFKQEGLLDNIDYAFVDIGWKGSGLYAINKLLKKRVRCFYWGTFKEYRNKYSCIFNTFNYNMRLPLYLITLMEDFFSSSPLLSTVGYEKNVKIKPVFDIESAINNENVVFSNSSSIQLFINGLKDMDLIDANIINEISNIVLSVLKNHINYLDFDSLSSFECFSEKGNINGLIHKLNLVQVIKYSIGMHINEIWPEACLYFTFPRLAKQLLIANTALKKAKKKIKKIIS